VDTPLELADLLDHLDVGLSVMTWHPEDPHLAEWVFVNEALCRMKGRSKADILGTPPFQRVPRETRAQIGDFNTELENNREFTAESLLLDKSQQPISVLMHMKLIKQSDGDLLLTEYHDIRSFKEMEARLTRAQDRTRNIMMLVGREKQQIADNIQGNLGLIALPMIGQLRLSATDSQKGILDILENRIRHITQRLGITAASGITGSNLTRRQMLICEMIRDGMTSKEIAAVTGCSRSTVNNHRNSIRKKLGLANKPVNLHAFLNSTPGGSKGSESNLLETALDRLI